MVFIYLILSILVLGVSSIVAIQEDDFYDFAASRHGATILSSSESFGGDFVNLLNDNTEEVVKLDINGENWINIELSDAIFVRDIAFTHSSVSSSFVKEVLVKTSRSSREWNEPETFILLPEAREQLFSVDSDFAIKSRHIQIRFLSYQGEDIFSILEQIKVYGIKDTSIEMEKHSEIEDSRLLEETEKIETEKSSDMSEAEMAEALIKIKEKLEHSLSKGSDYMHDRHKIGHHEHPEDYKGNIDYRDLRKSPNLRTQAKKIEEAKKTKIPEHMLTEEEKQQIKLEKERVKAEREEERRVKKVRRWKIGASEEIIRKYNEPRFGNSHFSSFMIQLIIMVLIMLGLVTVLYLYRYRFQTMRYLNKFIGRRGREE